MSEAPVEANGDWMGRLALALAFALVVMGMANNLPNIPGLLDDRPVDPRAGEPPPAEQVQLGILLSADVLPDAGRGPARVVLRAEMARRAAGTGSGWGAFSMS